MEHRIHYGFFYYYFFIVLYISDRPRKNCAIVSFVGTGEKKKKKKKKKKEEEEEEKRKKKKTGKVIPVNHKL